MSCFAVMLFSITSPKEVVCGERKIGLHRILKRHIAKSLLALEGENEIRYDER